MSEVHAPRLPRALAEATLDFAEPELVLDQVQTNLVTNIETTSRFLEVSESRISGLQLTAATFTDATLTDVLFEHCELSGVTFDQSTLTRVAFRDCRMSGFTATGLRGRDITFAECRLDGATFRMNELERARFENCILVEGDFTETQLRNSAFDTCSLERAQFHGARLFNTSLAGSQLNGLQGVASLRGASITSMQMLDLAPAMFTQLGIDIES